MGDTVEVSSSSVQPVLAAPADSTHCTLELRSSGKAPRGWSHLEWYPKEGGRALGTPAPPDPFRGLQYKSPPTQDRRGDSEHPHYSDGYLWAEAQSVGWDLGSETGDPLERAQPSWGLEADKRLLVLRMPAPSQTYLQPLSGDTYTHRATQGLPGWSWGGVSTIGTANPKWNQPLPHREGHSPHIPTESASYGPHSPRRLTDRPSQSQSCPLLPMSLAYQLISRVSLAASEICYHSFYFW